MMEQRVEFSKKLFIRVRPAKHRGWTHFRTGEEPSLWLTINDKWQWLPTGAERSARPGKMINSPKVMIFIFWSPLGFPVIEILPPR
jgi:hypothetical protein